VLTSFPSGQFGRLQRPAGQLYIGLKCEVAK
jgi:hypothetical protein